MKNACKCENCGAIPLKYFLGLSKYIRWVQNKKELISADLIEAFDIRNNSASNVLTKLAKLGIVSNIGFESNHYVYKVNKFKIKNNHVLFG